MLGPRQFVELSACGPGDPEAQHAGVILAAYFDAEYRQVFRQRLWRRLTAVAFAACFMAATTSLPQAALLLSLLTVGAAAAGAALMEWRAKEKLRALLDARGLDS